MEVSQLLYCRSNLASLVVELFKHLLYQRNQIPLHYTALLQVLLYTLQYLRQSGVGSRSFFAGLPKLSIFYCSGSGQIPAPAPTLKYVYLKETYVNCYWYFF